jgi:hypothetical protein
VVQGVGLELKKKKLNRITLTGNKLN